MTKKAVVNKNGIPDEYKRIDPSKVEEIVVYERKRPKKRKPKSNTIPAKELAKKLEALATPKYKVEKEDPTSAQSSVLSATPFTAKYRVSKRTKMLAEPRWKKHKHTAEDQESIYSYSSVAQSALSYMPTKRILELARPKGYSPYDRYNYLMYDNTKMKRFQV